MTTTLTEKYDLAADSWHASLERLQFDTSYNRLMAELDRAGAFVGLPQVPQVLDAGVGTGALSVALAQHHPVRSHFTGVDISERMLDETCANLRTVGIEPALVQGSITELQLPDAHYDIVMNAHVLEHLPDPAEGLREMARVLKPGAPLVTVTSRWCPFTMIQQGWWRYRIIPLRRLTRLMLDAGLTAPQEIVYGEARHVRHMSRAVLAFKP